MSDYALIRQDTGEAIVLLGVTASPREHPGRLSESPAPDRRTIADHYLREGVRSTILGILSTDYLGLPGDASYPERVRAWLDEVQGRHLLSLQEPGRPVLADMLLTSWSEQRGTLDTSPIRLELRQVRIAGSRTVELAATPRAPRADVADDLAREVDAGTATTSEAAAAPGVLGRLTGAFRAGSGL